MDVPGRMSHCVQGRVWHEFVSAPLLPFRGPPPKNGLPADTQPLQNRFVTLWVRIAQVCQKPSALGYQGQQPLAGTVIRAMRLEVLRQQRNALAQQSNLDFRRPGVGFVALICREDLPLRFNRQCHSVGIAPCLLLSRSGTSSRIPQMAHIDRRPAGAETTPPPVRASLGRTLGDVLRDKRT